MGVAALTAAWRQRTGGWPAAVPASGSAQPTHPVVEMYIGEAWTDISQWVRYEQGVVIRRGMSDAATALQAGRCALTVDNRDGRFTPRNPVGPWYGQIGRNTPIRVWRADGDVRRFRFHGEVTSWPPRWDTTGQDMYMPLEAAGMVQRLTQSGATRSTLYRALALLATTPPVAYWPCEDATGSTALASGLPGGQSMIVNGVPSLAAYSEFAASAPIPTVGTSTWLGNVPAHEATGASQVRFIIGVPAAGLTTGTILVRVWTTGTARRLDLEYDSSSSGGFGVRAYDQDGTLLDFTGYLSDAYNGKNLRVSIYATQSGANFTFGYNATEVGSADGPGLSVEVLGSDFGRIDAVRVGPNSDVGDAAIGHISVHTEVTSILDLTDELAAYVGETAGRRVERLAREEGIVFLSVGDLDDTAAMGTQQPGSLIGLLQECVDADMGVLYEPRDTLGLGYRTRVSLYNQTAALALDYAANELFGSVEPAYDDKDLANRVTATRQGGSSRTAELASGPLSVLAPPDGVYPYDQSVTVNVETDDQLSNIAGWRVRLGTVDETRYPKISVWLHNPRIAADTALVRTALVTDLGDRVTVSNLPSQLPPGDVQQLVQGTEEILRNPEHEITLVCAPAAPWNVATVDGAAYARADTGGSTVAQSVVSTTATSVDVHTTLSTSPVWITSDGIGGTGYAAQFPVDVVIGGEQMTVTACESKTWDTFTRSETDAWGTSDSGHTWDLAAGSVTERSVDGSQGLVVLSSAPSTIRFQQIIADVTDSEMMVAITPDQVATGAGFLPGIMFRGDGSRFYRCRLVLGTDQSVGLQVVENVTAIGSTVSLRWTYSAATKIWLRARMDGWRIRGRAWADGDRDPVTWQIDEVVPAGPNTFGSFGVTTSTFAGNTNVSPTFAYDAFDVITPQVMTVTRSVNGVTKSHARDDAVKLANPAYIPL